MLLYIVRHAWAEDRDENQWPDDSLRPLTADGEKRFAKMLKQLADAKFWPDIIATSPLVRCMQTAELIARRVHSRPKIEAIAALAPPSDLNALVEWTAHHADSQVAWVGHAPDVEHLAAQLIGDGDAAIHFKKGAVAAIRFDGPAELHRGTLEWLATAKLLGV
jgi:phosphohistidine phosphatase